MRAKGEIRRIQLSFVAGGEDGDDARGGGAQEELEEVVEEAHARVVTKGHEGVESFGCLCEEGGEVRRDVLNCGTEFETNE